MTAAFFFSLCRLTEMTATDVLKCSPLLWLLPTELLAKIVDDYLPDLPSVLRIWDSVENNTDSESNHARAWKKVLTMLAKNGNSRIFGAHRHDRRRVTPLLCRLAALGLLQVQASPILCFDWEGDGSNGSDTAPMTVLTVASKEGNAFVVKALLENKQMMMLINAPASPACNGIGRPNAPPPPPPPPLPPAVPSLESLLSSITGMENQHLAPEIQLQLQAEHASLAAEFQELGAFFSSGGGSASSEAGAGSVMNMVRTGPTALMAAAKGGHVEVVQLLLDAGANVSAKDENGYSALHFTASASEDDRGGWTGGTSYSATLQLLLDHKADIEACDHDGNTAFIVCGTKASEDRVKMECLAFLTPLCNTSARIGHGQETLLARLCREGDNDIALFLLEHQADVNCAAKDGSTALHWSAQYGRSALCKALLEAGADVNAKCGPELRETPLFWAAARGHVDTQALLRKHGGK